MNNNEIFLLSCLFASLCFNLYFMYLERPKKVINVDSKYVLGDTLVSSRGVWCTVIGVPTTENLKYAYSYKDGLIHIRKQSEVEDGRFSLLIEKKA